MESYTLQQMLDMKLHDILVIQKGFFWLMRVPGGWIYYVEQSIKKHYVYDAKIYPTQVSIATTFVPEPVIQNASSAKTHEGFIDWLNSTEQEQYPEPEPNQADDQERRFLETGSF